MNLNKVLLLAVLVCSVIASCPPEPKGEMHIPFMSSFLNHIIFWFISEYLYSCKANDEEGQDLSCTCRKLNHTEQYNCICFADYTPDGQYLDCLDAFKNNGQNKSGVYSLKPDNMSPFKVQHCL